MINLRSNLGFRKELKYLIKKSDRVILEERLKTIVKLDKNTSENSYKILSLYFDDYKETCYNQVLNGISERWKWRIRYYNFDTSYICLEKKYKIDGLNKKYKIRLTKEQVEDILFSRNIIIKKGNPKLLNEFYLNIHKYRLMPKVITVYDRMPYTYEAGNVRITIDYNLSSSNDFNNFFNKNIKLIPMLEQNNAILEVKYDDFMPDYIRFKLELNNLTRTPYSKYFQGVNILKLFYK